MAKRSTTPRPARTPKEVLQPKVGEKSVPRSGPGQPLGVEAIAAMTPEQLAVRAAELDRARAALKAAGDAAAAAQVAFDALANDATDEQRNDAINALEGAEKAVKAAEAALQALTNSTHNPSESDQGGAGNEAGPATGPRQVAAAAIADVIENVRSRVAQGDGAGALNCIDDQLAQIAQGRLAMDEAEKMLRGERAALGGDDAAAGLVKCWTLQLVRSGGEEHPIGTELHVPLKAYERLLELGDVTGQDPSQAQVARA